MGRSVQGRGLATLNADDPKRAKDAPLGPIILLDTKSEPAWCFGWWAVGFSLHDGAAVTSIVWRPRRGRRNREAPGDGTVRCRQPYSCAIPSCKLKRIRGK